MSGPRPVKAPTGSKLTCANWQIEAPYRMLQNNLDPAVAECPDDLVVYGGTGRAARSWDAYDAMLRTMATLKPEVRLAWSCHPSRLRCGYYVRSKFIT